MQKRVQVKEAECSCVGDAGLFLPTLVQAPGPRHTPLALILLFWETSVAALACQSKGVWEFNTMLASESPSIDASEGDLSMNVLILGDLFLEYLAPSINWIWMEQKKKRIKTEHPLF